MAESSPNPPPTPRPRPADPFSYGPSIRLPVRFMLLWACGAAIAVGGIAAAIAIAVRPGAAWSVVPGVGAVLGAVVVSALSILPWRARPMGRWVVAWMGGRLVSLAGVLLFGALLYFSSPSRPDIPVMGLTLGTSYFAAVVAEAWALSRRLKESPTLFDR